MTVKHKTVLFAYAVIAITALLLFNNLFYSFCWSDEGFYLSTVNRMMTGERLFIDDWSPTQSYEPLLYPLYALFIKIVGSTDGIYLFFRIVTLFFQVLTAVAAYCIFSKKMRRSASLTLALVALIFARACINGPSYYVIGCETYLLGIVALYAFFELHRHRLFLFISGIFFALAVLCNPYLALVYITVSAALLIFSATRKRWKLWLCIWAGTVFVAVIYIAAVLYKTDPVSILKSLKYIFNDPAYGRKPIHTIKRLYKCPRLILFPYVITNLPMIAAYIAVLKKRIALTPKTKPLLFLLNTILLVVNGIVIEKDCGAFIMAFFHYGIFTALLFSPYTLKKSAVEYKRELLYFIIPGLILSYFFCYASDTGFGVCSIGMVVVSGGIASVYIQSFENAFPSEKLSNRLLKYLPLAIIVCGTFFYRVNLTYRDIRLFPHIAFIPSRHPATEKITQGPASGLYTGSIYKRQYDSILHTLERIDTEKGDTIFISQLAPWAYLVDKNLACGAPTTWRLPPSDYRIEPYYEDFAGHRLPDYILFLDKSIRDNDNEISGNEWIIRRLNECGYVQTSVACGILYAAKRKGYAE